MSANLGREGEGGDLAAMTTFAPRAHGATEPAH